MFSKESETNGNTSSFRLELLNPRRHGYGGGGVSSNISPSAHGSNKTRSDHYLPTYFKIEEEDLENIQNAIVDYLSVVDALTQESETRYVEVARDAKTFGSISQNSD